MKLHGSGHATRRNRQFLQQFETASNNIVHPYDTGHVKIDDMAVPTCLPEVEYPSDQQNVTFAGVISMRRDFIYPDPARKATVDVEVSQQPSSKTSSPRLGT